MSARETDEPQVVDTEHTRVRRLLPLLQPQPPQTYGPGGPKKRSAGCQLKRSACDYDDGPTIPACPCPLCIPRLCGKK